MRSRFFLSVSLAALAWSAQAGAQDQKPQSSATQPNAQDSQPQAGQGRKQNGSQAGSQQPSAPTAPPPPPPSFAEAGPWSFTGVFIGDGLADVAGGAHRGVALLGKAAVSASYDGSQDGHDGINGLVSAQYVGGGRISGHKVGDIQGVSNIEAFSALRLYELWLSKDYAAWGWKAGLIDLNVDFDTQNVGALFLNSADGVGPELGHSGLNGPSIFPTTALAATFHLQPRDGMTLRAGLFDGTAGSPYHPGDFAIRLSGKDGVLGIIQAEQRFGSGVRVEAGAWAYSAYFDALHRFDAAGNPRRYQRSRGAYGTVEGQIASDASDPDRGLAGWIRVGIADPIVQRVSAYIGGGLVYSGPFAFRKDDQAGFAINHAIVDLPLADPAETPHHSSETTFELTYRYNAKDWLAVQPDAQYVVHPNGDRAIGDALVIGVRLTVTLTRNLARRLKDKAAP